jgi:signal peptidase I
MMRMRIVKEYWVPLRLRNDDRPVPRLLRSVHEFSCALVLALLTLVLLGTFLVRPAMVEGGSMEPTLRNGQWLLVSAFPRDVAYGDIVVISGEGTGLGKTIVKRMIGLPGDEIDIDFRRGVVYRNGIPLQEDVSTRRQYDMIFPLTVSEGHCFVLGDNRGESEDSRSSHVGLIDLRYIIGVNSR